MFSSTLCICVFVLFIYPSYRAMHINKGEGIQKAGEGTNGDNFQHSRLLSSFAAKKPALFATGGSLPNQNSALILDH